MMNLVQGILPGSPFRKITDMEMIDDVIDGKSEPGNSDCKSMQISMSKITPHRKVVMN